VFRASWGRYSRRCWRRVCLSELQRDPSRSDRVIAKAADVRLRAERRTGELLKELARDPASKGGDQKSASKDATPKSPYAAALDSTGLTRQTYRTKAGATLDRASSRVSNAGRAQITSPICRASKEINNMGRLMFAGCSHA
jgi:hypothetical protein